MTTIRLKDRKSHTGNIKGHEVKFHQDRCFPTDDPDIIAYCRSKGPGMFLIAEPAPKPAAKPAPREEEPTEEASAPKPRSRGGKRRKVKVDEDE